jgi:hypothetical protein
MQEKKFVRVNAGSDGDLPCSLEGGWEEWFKPTLRHY